MIIIDFVLFLFLPHSVNFANSNNHYIPFFSQTSFITNSKRRTSNERHVIKKATQFVSPCIGGLRRFSCPASSASAAYGYYPVSFQ